LATTRRARGRVGDAPYPQIAPGHDVPARRDHKRREIQARQHAPHGRADLFRGSGLRRRRTQLHEIEEIVALGSGKTQHRAEALEYACRGPHVSPLLEPREVGGADSRQRSDFLAPQASRMTSFIEQSVRRILRACALVTASSMYLPAPALAADAPTSNQTAANQPPTSDQDALQEVVVTAQFRQQRLQDTPIAITAVNAAMMEQRGQSSLHDLADQAPNVTLLETGGAFGLYTVKPQGDDTGTVRASYGSRSLIDLQAMGDVALIPDKLFMRVAAVSHQQDGYVTRVDYGCLHPTSGIPAVGATQGNCIAGKEGGKDYIGGRVALRWLPAENFEVNLTGGYPPGNAAGVAYDSRFVPGDPLISYASFCGNGLAGNTYCWSPDTYTRSWGTNLTLDWKLSDDLSLKSITGFRELDSEWTEDNDVSPLSGSLGAEKLLNHTLTEELRLNGKVSSLIDYTVGGFFLGQVTTYPTHQVLDYVIPGLNFEFLGNDPVWEQDWAAFANATWHITEALNLNAGVRYTQQEKNYTYVRENPATTGGGDSIFFTPGFSGTVGPYEGSKVDYRANLDYRWTDQLMTYASISTGFKGGGSNPRPFIPSQVVSFNPETLTAYEIGAKSDWLDRSLRVNLSAFYNKYKDIQVVLLSCPQFSGGNAAEPCAAPVNGGDAKIYGVELETVYHIMGLSLEGSASKQHFQYTDINPASGIPLGAPGQAFQPMKWSLAAQYEIHLPLAATLTPRVDFIYNSGFFTNSNADPQSYNPGYHEVNARITYRPDGDKWEASLMGLNLGDKLWYTSVFDLYASSGALYGMPSAPRTVEVQFKRNF
jgi:iron complex outermembrane recepter protein